LTVLRFYSVVPNGKGENVNEIRKGKEHPAGRAGRIEHNQEAETSMQPITECLDSTGWFGGGPSR